MMITIVMCALTLMIISDNHDDGDDECADNANENSDDDDDGKGLLDSRRCVRLEYLCGSIVTAAQSLPLPVSRTNAIVMAAFCRLRRRTQ